MKRNLFLYLFVFALLLNIFQYVNSKHIIDKYEQDIKKYKAKIEAIESKKSLSNISKDDNS
jgi:hypothetical protein